MQFKGALRFLSNFYPSPIRVPWGRYPTVEHAYQAAKTCIPGEREVIIACATPGQAKRAGRKLKLREDWERVKLEFMRDALRAKFWNTELGDMLMCTREPLIEHNRWHDNYWGSCLCQKCGDHGKNHLGKLLMDVREELRNDKRGLQLGRFF